MNSRYKSTLLKILRLVFLSLCIFLLIAWVIISPDTSIQNLVKYSPKNSFVAAVAILMLYAFKSITVLFPLIILEITAGYLFSPWKALLINFIGILIVLTIPYGIGRATGMNTIHKKIESHPKIK